MAAVKEAIITYNGTLTGMSQTRGAGDLLQLVNRPQEAVAALQQLNRAYDNYYAAINGYNRAQFQLYRALGFPARDVICDCPVGEVQPWTPLGRPAWPPSAATCFRALARRRIVCSCGSIAIAVESTRRDRPSIGHRSGHRAAKTRSATPHTGVDWRP